MKLLLVVFLCLGSIGAFAEEKKSFEEVKANMASRLSARMTKLQEAKSCVDSAKDKEGLKACRKIMKDFNEQMKANREAKGKGKGKGKNKK